MNLTLNLIRHGKTPGNLKGAFVGRLDHPLAPQGEAELRELVEKGAYPKVQAVFCSPLTRCRQTAETIYPGVPVRIVEDLQERHFGEFEGKTHDEIIAIPGYSEWGMNPESMQFPGGEETLPFYERCNSALWEVVDRCANEQIGEAAIIAHGGVIMALMYANAEPKKDYYGWFCNNGCGYRLECDTEARTMKLQRSIGD